MAHLGHILLFFTLALLLTLAGANSNRHRIDPISKLIYKDQVKELHYFYNTNLDALSAVWGASGNSAKFEQRVSNVLGVFCPDPDFQGWFARVGVQGQVVYSARHRDTPSTIDYKHNLDSNGQPVLSVLTVYRDLFAQNFSSNSSQHFVGMPIVDIYYGDDDRLYADVNCTLHQTYLYEVSPKNYYLAHAFNHYMNQFVFYENGGVNGDGFWCMRQFNSNNDFGPLEVPNSFIYTGQLGVDALLSGDIRPDP